MSVKPLKINSIKTWKIACRRLLSLWREYRYLKISIQAGKRGLDMNALSHCFYKEIAGFRGDITVDEAHCECKLYYGVPILLAEDEEFRDMYNECFRWMDTETKLKRIKFIPVTRIMTNKQFKTYLSILQQTYAEEGLILESNKDE